MPILNPNEFFKATSTILAGMGQSKVFRSKFSWPELKDDKGQFVFIEIANYLARTCDKEWLKGYLDLDYEWQTSKDEQIVALRNADGYKDFKTPFSGRKMYQAMIQIAEIEYEEGKVDANQIPIMVQSVDKNNVPLKDTQGNPIMVQETETKKKIGVLKPFKSGSMMLEAQINIFHNVILGWKPEWAQKPKLKWVNPATGMEEIIEDNSDGGKPFVEQWRFKKVNIFVHEKDMQLKLEKFGEDMLKQSGKKPPLEFLVFLIAGDFDWNEWTNPRTNKTEKQPKLFLDEVI